MSVTVPTSMSIVNAGISALAWIALATIPASCPAPQSPVAQAEPVFRYSALDNGDFSQPQTSSIDGSGLAIIPWWKRAPQGKAQLVRKEGATWMRTSPGDWIEQPIPAWAPLVRSLVVRGRVENGATCSILDSHDAPVPTVVERDEAGGRVVVRIAEAGSDGGAQDARPMPRLRLRLIGGWTDVTATVDLPCPSEAQLRSELIAEIDEILRTWFERGIDDVGPRKTGFLAKVFDAVTGEQITIPKQTGFHPVYQAVLDATDVEDKPEWRAILERMIGDYLVLQLNPDTGLPRNWNSIDDTPDDETPVEIAQPLGFLIDVATRGPDRFRARARTAAKKIGDTVLRKGLMPDGTCAASYVPRDGTPNPNVGELRRLNVPLQLVRLSKLLEDPRYAKAAHESLVTLEFTNYWPGTWDTIDPGFDDSFGNFGGSAARALRDAPDEADFRRFALEGWKHYEPIWRDALSLGGNVAADQVRCWKIAVDLAHVEPSMRAGVGPLLRMAARSHFKGEQYGNGAWGDVTIFGFSPKTTLQVGDLTGSPQNLLTGLAFIYTDEIGLRTDELRAMYTTVLRSSVAQYKKRYGFLADRTERKGANSAAGSFRMLTGMVEMLRALSPPK